MPRPTAAPRPRAGRPALTRSYVIEIAGVFAGAAALVAGRYRFIAVHPRLRALDRQEFANLTDLRHAAANGLRGMAPG